MSHPATLAPRLEATLHQLLGRVATELLIGDWQPAAGGRRFPVLNPATGAELAMVADASAQEALRALEAAETARVSWARRPPRHRATSRRRCGRGQASQCRTVVDEYTQIKYTAQAFGEQQPVDSRPGRGLPS